MKEDKVVKQTMTAPMIRIGGVPVESVRELHYTILDILEADCDESTKRLALKTLGKGVTSNVTNTSITNTTFKTFDSLGEEKTNES